MTTKFEFTPAIQEKILAMMLFAPGHVGENINAVRPELFDHPALRDMATILYKFRHQYQRMPDVEEFAEEFEKLVTSSKRIPEEEYRTEFTKVMDAAESDFRYVAEKTLDFVQYQACRNAISDAADEFGKAAKRGKRPDYEKLSLKIQSAMAMRSAGEEIMINEIEAIEPEETTWLWPNRFALGKLSLIVGDPESGKSLFSTWMAAKVSSGAAWPDCSVPQVSGKVIILQSEDGLADTVRPRLAQYGADLANVSHVSGVRTASNEERMFSLLFDVENLKKVIRAKGSVRLVIMDPLQGYFGGALSGKVNTNADAHIRAILRPLTAMAEEMNVAVVGVMHLNKASMMDAAYRVGGSIAITAVPRAVWLIKWDRDPDGIRYFQALKSNRKAGVKGLAFKVDKDNGDVSFQDVPVPLAGDLLSPTFAEPGSADAKRWLREQLTVVPKNSKDLLEAGEQEGFSHGMLYRAKKALGLKARRIGGEGRGAGHWEWSLW